MGTTTSAAWSRYYRLREKMIKEADDAAAGKDEAEPTEGDEADYEEGSEKMDGICCGVFDGPLLWPVTLFLCASRCFLSDSDCSNPRMNRYVINVILQLRDTEDIGYTSKA